MNENKTLIVLRRLAKRQTRLIAEAKSGGARYEIVEEGASRRKKQTVTAQIVRQWLSDGLVEPCPGGYRLASAGASRVRRQLSATDNFQTQHQSRSLRVIDYEGMKQPAIVNDAESPLKWLASRKDKSGARLLTAFQLEAGERIRADYQFAGLAARVTASWSPTAQRNGSGGASDAAGMQDNVLAARQRVIRALAAVGPELSGILVDVCCHLKGLEEAEKTEGWPQRSGKVILQMALTRLARHYGLVSDDQVNGGVRRRLSHWGVEDYKPRASGGKAAS